MLTFPENEYNDSNEPHVKMELDNDLALGLGQCYIERERLQLGALISSGNFGDVFKGKLKNRDSSMVDVAVKSLKSDDLFSCAALRACVCV